MEARPREPLIRGRHWIAAWAGKVFLARANRAAAASIGKPLRTWQNGEAPINSRAHRAMDPAFFELFQIKLRECAPKE